MVVPFIVGKVPVRAPAGVGLILHVVQLIRQLRGVIVARLGCSGDSCRGRLAAGAGRVVAQGVLHRPADLPGAGLLHVGRPDVAALIVAVGLVLERRVVLYHAVLLADGAGIGIRVVLDLAGVVVHAGAEGRRRIAVGRALGYVLPHLSLGAVRRPVIGALVVVGGLVLVEQLRRVAAVAVHVGDPIGAAAGHYLIAHAQTLGCTAVCANSVDSHVYPPFCT